MIPVVTGAWSHPWRRGWHTVSVRMRTLGVRRRVSDVYYELLVERDGTVAPLTVIFPMDRRQARRVARRTGRTFRWKDGDATWR